jgi:hypothetical protein
MTEYLDIKPFLSKEELNLYFDKIKPCKIHEVYVLIANGLYSVEKEPNKYTRMTYEEFKIYQQETKNQNKPNIYIGKKTDINSYMYDFETEENLDEQDKKFLVNKDLKPETLFGLHNYGGYYGFFRPSLTEVIHMLNTKISVKDLEKIERIYVTTEAYPSDKIYECYDNVEDKHQAITSYFVVYKETKKRKEVSEIEVMTEPKKQKLD